MAITARKLAALCLAVAVSALLLSGYVYRPVNTGVYRGTRAAAFGGADSWRTLIWESGGQGITSEDSPALWAQSDIVCPSAYKIFSPTDNHEQAWVDSLKKYNPGVMALGFDFPDVLYPPGTSMHNAYNWYGDRYDAVVAGTSLWYVKDTNGDTAKWSSNMNAYVANLANTTVRDSLVAVIARKVRASGNLRDGAGLFLDVWEFRKYGVLLGKMRSKTWDSGDMPDMNSDLSCDTTDARILKWGMINFVNELRDELGSNFIIGANSISALVDSELAGSLDFTWLEDIHRETTFSNIYNSDFFNFMRPNYDDFPDAIGGLHGGDGKGRNWTALKANMRKSKHGPFIIFGADHWGIELMLMSLLDDSFYVALNWPNGHLHNYVAYNTRRYYYPADHRMPDIHLVNGGAIQYSNGARDSCVQYREFENGSVLVVWLNTDGAHPPQEWVGTGSHYPFFKAWVCYGTSGTTQVIDASLPGGTFDMRGGEIIRRNAYLSGDQKTIVVSSDTSTTRTGAGSLWPVTYNRRIQDCAWSHLISNASGAYDSTGHVTYTSGSYPFMISYTYEDVDGATNEDWPIKFTWGPAYQTVLWFPLEWTKEYDIMQAQLRFCQYSSGACESTSDTIWAHGMGYPASDTLWADSSAGGSFSFEADSDWIELDDGVSANKWGGGSTAMDLSHRGNQAKRGIRSYKTNSSALSQDTWYAFDVTEYVRMVSLGMPNVGWLISYQDGNANDAPASWRAYGPEGQYSGARDPFLVITAARRDTIGP